MTYTNQTRKIPEFPFHEDSLKEAWRRRKADIAAMGEGSEGRIIAREKGGILAYRATEKTLTITGYFNSATHGKKIAPKIRKISRESEITQKMVDWCRTEAAEKQRRANGAADFDPENERKLKSYAKTSMRELAEIYYAESEQFASLRKTQQRARKGIIKHHFLDYSPTGNKGNAFGEHKRGPRLFLYTASELRKWRDDKRKAAKQKDKHFMFNRTRCYLMPLFKWLAENHYIPKEAIISVKPLPEPKKVRIRKVSLGDDMLRALWNASEKVEPYARDFVRLLMLTGQRRTIIGALKWSEVRLDSNIPQLRIGADDPDRAKNDEPYALPITGYIADIIRNQPRYEGCDYVFTASGKNPVTCYSKIKITLDKHMKTELGAAFHPWRFHDLRRSVTDKLSAAGVSSRIRELVIAHSPSWDNAAQAHYDVSDYILEKAEAMDKLHHAMMVSVGLEKANDTNADIMKQLAAMAPADRRAILSQFLG